MKNTANEIQVWDLPTGKKTLVINRQAGRLQCVAFSPDGKHLASSAWKGVVIWDAVTGKRGVPLYLPAVNPEDSPMEDRPTTVPAPPAGHSMADEYDLSFAAGWVTYSRDGSVLAAAGPASVRVWKAVAAEPRLTMYWLRGEPMGWGMALSPDGTRVATTTERARPAKGRPATRIKVQVHDTTTGKQLMAAAPKVDVFVSLAFSPDGKHLAVGTSSDDKDEQRQICPLLVIDSHTGKTVRILTGHRHAILSVCYRPGGRHLVASSLGGELKLWDPLTGREAWGLDLDKLAPLPKLKAERTRHSRNNYAPTVAFSPDGKHLAAACRDGKVRMWTLRN